jgi:prepilin-type N-terminal cleavage/methylation domain-containing protein
MKKLPLLARKCQRGLTLIEMVIVVAIIGIVIGILAAAMTGSTTAAKATAKLQTANKAANNWMMLTQTAGVSSAVTSNPLLAASKTVEDIVFEGRDNVLAAQQAKYDQSKILPLSDSAAKSGSNWLVGETTVTFTGGGSATPFRVVFDKVGSEEALEMIKKYSPATTATAAGTFGPLTVAADGTAWDVTYNRTMPN